MAAVAARVGMTLRTHRGYSQCSHIISHLRRLTGRVGDIHVVVEDTHSKSNLSQFAITHLHVGLESSVLSHPHSWEIHRELRAPVCLFEVSQMACHHHHLRAPILQSDKRTHTYLVHSRLSHTVISVEAPFKVRLRSSGVIHLISLLVVSLLEANHSVETMISEFCIFLRSQWHHLNLQVVEIRLSQVESLCDIFHTRLHLVLSSEHQQVVKRSEFLYCLIFPHNLLLGENRALHWVLHMKTAIHARV